MRLLLSAVTVALLAACAHAPTPPLAAPAAIHTRQVPPVPATLAQRVGAYADFRGAGLLDWSPDGRELLLSCWRADNTQQLHRLGSPGSRLEPLTRASEPTTTAEWLPADAGEIVFERDAGGSEAAQVYRLELASGRETRLTDPDHRHDMGPFTRAGTELIVSSVPLDRTAAGGSRSEIDTEFTLLDPRSGRRRVLAALKGVGWYPIEFSAADSELLLGRYRSATESELWRLDLASGKTNRVLPATGGTPAFFGAARYADDGRLFLTSDHAGEFRQLYRYAPVGASFELVSRDSPWDVASFELSKDRRTLAAIVNQRGRGELRVYDATSLTPVAVPAIPGSVTRIRFAPDGKRLALSVASAATPSEVMVLDLERGELVSWVRADTAGLDTSSFSPTEVFEWSSFDGRTVSGLITRPPAKFSGKRPVLIEIHGGPESQSRLGFKGRYNYLINERGVVLIEPNVRGSAGFGKTFLALDNGRRREDSVKDIGSLLDWIAAQPDLDASRVVVQGGSYGGYMALAVASFYSDRIRGAIDTVGISNFVSFLEHTESYRRDLRRVEYGDERDPAMREFLLSISPTRQAHRIRVPLFVVHGRNDPRVPVLEAEQIAATVEKNGIPVWLMIADNEGHGFAKKENADYLFLARLLFLERWLLK